MTTALAAPAAHIRGGTCVSISNVVLPRSPETDLVITTLLDRLTTHPKLGMVRVDHAYSHAAARSLARSTIEPCCIGHIAQQTCVSDVRTPVGIDVALAIDPQAQKLVDSWLQMHNLDSSALAPLGVAAASHSYAMQLGLVQRASALLGSDINDDSFVLRFPAYGTRKACLILDRMQRPGSNTYHAVDTALREGSYEYYGPLIEPESHR